MAFYLNELAFLLSMVQTQLDKEEEKVGKESIAVHLDDVN